MEIVGSGGGGVVVGFPTLGGLAFGDVFDSRIAVLECWWRTLGVVCRVGGGYLRSLFRSVLVCHL